LLSNRHWLTAARRASLIVFPLLFVLLAARPSRAQILAGSITALNGTATITRGTRNFPATYAARIDVGDQVVTSSTGRLTITLTDSSQLELTESSTLLISQDLVNPNGSRAQTTVTLMGGLVRSLVRFTAGTPPNYEVHTPNAVVSARGTTFDTYFTNNTSRLGFPGCRTFTDALDYDGVVEVSSHINPTSQIVILHPGQKTTVACAHPPLRAHSLAETGLGFEGAPTGLDPKTIAAGSFGVAGVVSAGVIGGYAAAGGFSSSSTPSPTPTPLAPLSPTM
jgi:hypothetical protein